MSQTILVKPIITEKSIDRVHDQLYTFEVDKGTNKHQIKEAVEKLFSVNVRSVKTINRVGKEKRVGKMRRATQMSRRRYALVKIAKDQTIDAFSITPEQTK
ncbi:MAG: 50S ribosomal protein L23 [Candidatus Roizmanbacteria bacterium]|nr:50S ribosomal protein L23 [Candidatus Roizmanbacteria bacterium]